MTDLPEKIVSALFDLADTDGGLIKSRAVERVREVIAASDRQVFIGLDPAKPGSDYTVYAVRSDAASEDAARPPALKILRERQQLRELMAKQTYGYVKFGDPLHADDIWRQINARETRKLDL